MMRAVVTARDWSWEELERVRREKATKRGGFERRLLLREAVESE